MNKKDILLFIRQMLEDNIRELTNSLETYRTGTDLDEDDTMDPDDFSQQTESRDMLLLIQNQLNQAQGQINRLQGYADKECSVAEPGAVIETDKNLFFIGVSFPQGQYKGKELLGLSSESPAYATIKGKSNGDTFHIGSTKHTIENIY